VERPLEPENLRTFIENTLIEYWDKKTKPEFNNGFVGSLIGHIERAIKDTLLDAKKEELSAMRRKIFGYLFDHNGEEEVSTKDLLEDEVYALAKWVNAINVGEKWCPDNHLSDEIRFLTWRLL
jgi:hypothetical protein